MKATKELQDKVNRINGSKANAVEQKSRSCFSGNNEIAYILGAKGLADPERLEYVTSKQD
jgi:hypothetical protein